MVKLPMIKKRVGRFLEQQKVYTNGVKKPFFK